MQTNRRLLTSMNFHFNLDEELPSKVSDIWLKHVRACTANGKSRIGEHKCKATKRMIMAQTVVFFDKFYYKVGHLIWMFLFLMRTIKVFPCYWKSWKNLEKILSFSYKSWHLVGFQFILYWLTPDRSSFKHFLNCK